MIISSKAEHQALKNTTKMTTEKRLSLGMTFMLQIASGAPMVPELNSVHRITSLSFMFKAEYGASVADFTMLLGYVAVVHTCSICVSPLVIPMTHRSFIMSCIVSENGTYGSCHTMPIMPGITGGEMQIAQLAFIKQCQMCILRFLTGNTNDTPVLNYVLYRE